MNKIMNELGKHFIIIFVINSETEKGNKFWTKLLVKEKIKFDGLYTI